MVLIFQVQKLKLENLRPQEFRSIHCLPHPVNCSELILCSLSINTKIRKVAQVLEQLIKEESQELDKVAGWIRASCEHLYSTKCSNLHTIDFLAV